MNPFFDQFEILKMPNLGLVRFPMVAVDPKRYKALDLKPEADQLTYLKTAAWRGYQRKAEKGVLGALTRQQAIDRLKMEFDVFVKTGTVGYIALIHDLLQWCDEEGVARGPARGSCAASFVFFCLGITKIDPIRFGLTFTRFISEARVKPKVIDGIVYADGKMVMDVDIDISFTERARVIQHVKDTFPGSVCGICNQIGFAPKVVVKDVCKAYLGMGMDEAQRVSDWIEVRFGKSQSIQEAIDGNAAFKDWVSQNPRHGEVIEIAKSIENLNASKGQHASGVFISYTPLDGYVPTELSKPKDGEESIVTSYDMDIAALIGVKIDLLGLRNMSVIDRTCKALGMHYDDIDVNDPSIYSYISTSKLYNGLFQISKGLTAEAVHKIKPRNIDQLGACLAISRPGALKYIDDFAKAVNDGVIKAIHPAFDAILAETGGILVYQEQINEILQRVYGIEATLAEEMRRAIGKKVREELLKFEPILYERGTSRDVPKEVTKYFWDVCNSSADYLFNKSHSASYSFVTAYTTYLKANHTQEFCYQLLQMAKHETDSQEALMVTIGECPKLGIKILPPDITRSEVDFSKEDGSIRFGLSSIRGLSDATYPKLLALRGQTFETKWQIFDAARAASLQINMLCGLIYCGCLSWRDTPRVRLALEAQVYNLLSDGQKAKVKGFAQNRGMDDIIEILKQLPVTLNEKGKPLIAVEQINRIRRDHEPYWAMYLSNSKNEALSHYILERHFLGFSFSGSLHGIYSAKVPDLITLEQLKQKGAEIAAQPPPTEGVKREKAPPLRVVGFVEEVRSAVSKANGSPYLKITITDDTASFMAMCYGEERLESCRTFNGGKLPEEGDIVILTGSLSKDGRLLFAETAIIQPNPVMLTKKDATEAALAAA